MTAINKTLLCRADAMVTAGSFVPRNSAVAFPNYPIGSLPANINDLTYQPDTPDTLDIFIDRSVHGSNPARFTFPDIMEEGSWVSKLTLWHYSGAGPVSISVALTNGTGQEFWCEQIINNNGAFWRSVTRTFVQTGFEGGIVTPNLDGNNLELRFGVAGTGSGQFSCSNAYAEVELSYKSPVRMVV